MDKSQVQVVGIDPATGLKVPFIWVECIGEYMAPSVVAEVEKDMLIDGEDERRKVETKGPIKRILDDAELNGILARGMEALLSKYDVLMMMVAMDNKITWQEREDLRILSRYLNEVIGQVTYHSGSIMERQNELVEIDLDLLEEPAESESPPELTADIKFPDIHVTLVGTHGNAWSIMGLVKQALVEGGVSEAEIEEYLKASMAGDYDNLLVVAMGWVVVS